MLLLAKHAGQAGLAAWVAAALEDSRAGESDLAAVVLHSVDAFRALAADKGIAMKVATAACPRVRFERQRILQVLANLIGNAIKFTPAGGRITVRLDRRDEDVRLVVEDTGIGVEEAEQARIFDPFFSTKGPGRGLGLSATLGIVRRHGGALSIDSEPGRGTAVKVTLPIRQTATPTGR